MRAKLILIILALIAVLLVSAQEGGISYTIIYNCQEAGYNNCELTVSPIYKYDTVPTGGAQILFPENPISKDFIGCADEKTVTLAKYDGTAWVPITSEIKVTPAGVQAEAYIDHLGELALIKKTAQTGFPPSESCIDLGCGDLGAFITDPFNIYMTPDGKSLQSIKENTETRLMFCGMLPGCQVNPNNPSCEESETRCQKGIAQDCMRTNGGTCTKDPDSCCNPSPDGTCDSDCYTENDQDGPLAVDPDCAGTRVDALAGLELAIRRGDGEWGMGVLPAPTYDEGWKTYELGEEWGLPAIIAGPVQFSVSKGSDSDQLIKFARFQYLDYFTDEWHYMAPAESRPNGQTTGSSTNFADDEWWDFGILWRRPTMWMQAKSDDVKNQFYFLNAPVKRIKFQAKVMTPNAQFSPPEEFAVRFWTLGDESTIDPDKDGVASQEDCDDSNPNIHPGATELCNGIDDNCNLYNITDESTATFRQTITLENTGADHETSVWLDGGCDGYIQFTRVVPLVYGEIKRVDAFMPNMTVDTNNEDEGKALPGESYSIASWFGINPAVFNNDDQAIADHFGYGPVSALPSSFLERNRVIIYAARCASDNDGCLTTNDGWKRGGGCSDGNCGCIPGMIDSCTCEAGTREPDCAEANGMKNPQGSNSNIMKIFARDAKARDWTNPIQTWPAKRGKPIVSETSSIGEYPVKIKRGDILKFFITSDGEVSFDVYCYSKKPNWNNIDEGCERKMAQIHVCAQDSFSQQARKCLGTILCQTEVLEASISTSESALNPKENVLAACPITPTSDEVGQHDFYTYVCPQDKPCYKFYTGKYQVCATKEVCSDGVDNDCDGLIDYEDPDCKGVCAEGDCDLKNKKWCKTSELVSQDYCLHCGHRDATCYKSCGANETCEGGCTEGACDTAADLLCKGGAWTSSGYQNACKNKDSELSSSCTAGACDTEQNKTCYTDGRWLAEAMGVYCLRDCGKQDIDCYDKRKELDKKPYCQAGSCDIYSNKQCLTDNTWTNQNYCKYCGATDSDCGPKACTDKITVSGTQKNNCDYVNKKYCKNGQWTGDGYCALETCGADPASSTACACAPTADKETEALCNNGKDDDCDGYQDCADPDCPKDLPGCGCTEGQTKECCSDPLRCQGLCAQEKGTQKCTNGKWTACEGATAPATEVCNAADDNCDGSTDEGCGDCKTAQTRNCGVDKGACGAGVQECSGTGRWSLCFGAGYKKAEPEECDGVDNNCDGQVDEGCSCKEGTTQSCGSDIGECKKGNQTCANGQWAACLGGIDKMAEVGSACLDSKDNDCDGKMDSADENCGATPDAELNPVCYDAIQNQDEEQIDCGGSKCEPCDQVTCNDRQRNGNEEGIDCGGSCSAPCRGKKATTTEEASAEEQPTEESAGEQLPDTSTGGFPWLYIIGGVVVLGGILLLLFNKKGGKTATQEFKPKAQPQRIYSGQTTQPQPKAQQQRPLRERVSKSKEESKLDKSFEEAKNLFK